MSINLSLNTMSGPHDGDGHFERRLSSLLKSGQAGPEMKGRAVVIAAGNLPDQTIERQQWQHITDNVLPAQPFAFFWLHLLSSSAPDRTRNSLEIWYDAQDAWLQVSLTPPGGAALGPIVPGQAAELLRRRKGARLHHRLAYSTGQCATTDQSRIGTEIAIRPKPLPDEDCVPADM